MHSSFNTSILFLLLISASSYTSFAQNIEVEIRCIRSSIGVIAIAVYQDNDSFKKDNPCLQKIINKKGLLNGVLITRLSIPPGTYGLAILDDENNDNKMNYNVVGIPKEGFGFSNYFHNGLKSPKFDVFRFEVGKNQNKKVICKMKYMYNKPKKSSKSINSI